MILLPIRKKILLVSLILLLVLMLTGCFGLEDENSTEENIVWKSYSNSHYGMKYPEGWKKSNKRIDNDDEGTEINIYFAAGSLFPDDPNDFDTSNFKPYVLVDETSYTEPVTNGDLDNLKDDLPSWYSDAVKIESTKQINFNGKYAYEFILSGAIDPDLEENSSFNSKVKVIVFAEENYQYRLTYYTTPDNYDSYIGVANEIINSIEIF